MLYYSTQARKKNTTIEFRVLLLIFSVVLFINTPAAYLESLLYPYIFNKVEVWSSVYNKEISSVQRHAQLAESPVVKQILVDGSDVAQTNQLFDIMVQSEQEQYTTDIELLSLNTLRSRSRFLSGKLEIYYFTPEHHGYYHRDKDNSDEYTVYYPVYNQQRLLGYVAVSVIKSGHDFNNYDNVFLISSGGVINGIEQMEAYLFKVIGGYDEDLWIELDKEASYKPFGSLKYKDSILIYSKVETTRQPESAYLVYYISPTETFLYYLPNIITYTIVILLIAAYIYYEFYKRSRQLENKANLDELSGLHNRAFYNKVKSNFLDGNFYIGILDIDHFKQVNDSYGHDVGDRVIKQVAQTIKTTKRDKDFAFRIGGEEFVLIMEADSFEHAQIAFERIRNSVADSSSTPLVTASLGFTRMKYSADKSFKVADQQLYQAKDAGRNQTLGIA